MIKNTSIKKGKYQSKIQYDGFKTPIKQILDIKLNSPRNAPFIHCKYLSMYNPLKYLTNPNNYISENRQITINIELPANFNKDQYDILYKTLIEQIRHELQHMMDDDNLLPVKTNFNSGYDINKLLSQNIKELFTERTKYILSLTEQEPFIRGMVLKAKKQGIPFENMLNVFIKNQLFGDNVKMEKQCRTQLGNNVDKTINSIKKTYLEKACKIFPNIRRI